MGIDKDKGLITAAVKLRRRAEERLQAKTSAFNPHCSEEAKLELVHELEVHQIELEMQNAELRQARQELETALDKYTDLYDFAPIAYFILDRDGAVRAANLTGASHLGIERARLLGKRFGKFVAHESRLLFSEFLGKVFASHSRELCDIKLIGKGNSPLFVHIEAIALGAGQECRVAFSDITRRKRAEDELAATVDTLREEIGERDRAEESLLRLNRLYAVLREIDHAVIRTNDCDSLFRDFCRIAVEQGGFLLSWVGLLDPENGEVLRVASCGATGYLDDICISAKEESAGIGPTGISIRDGNYYICNDFLNDPCTQPWHERGRTYGINASASVPLREQGSVIGALTLYAGEKDFFDRQHVDLLVQMGADISFALDNLTRESCRQKAEQTLLEETLEKLRALEELREKEQMLVQQSRLAALGDMINNIAHQWRQPLNVLGLLIQQMKLYYDMGSFSKEYLDTSVNKSMGLINHMSQTIDDFRNFFKPDKEMVEFRLHDVVARTVSLVEDGFKNQRIRIDVTACANPAIIGYPNEYSQVLLNILVNARDALLERCPDNATVTVTISTEGKRAVVTIADNAGGIAEEAMGKIFEPYFTSKGPDKGTGVGLFMSKTIIEKNMNGRLTVRNTTEGAEFRIEV